MNGLITFNCDHQFHSEGNDFKALSSATWCLYSRFVNNGSLIDLAYEILEDRFSIDRKHRGREAKSSDTFVESDEVPGDPEDLLTGVIKVSATLKVAFTYRGRYFDSAPSWFRRARYWPASADCPWYSGVRSLSDWTSSSCRWRIWSSRRRARDSRRISSACGPLSRPGPPRARWGTVAWRAPPVPGPPRRSRTRRRSCRRRAPSRPRARARASRSCSAEDPSRRGSPSHVDWIGGISSRPPDPASRRARRRCSRRARERPGYTARAFVGRRRPCGRPPSPPRPPSPLRGPGLSSPSSRAGRSSWAISRRVSPSRRVGRRRPRWRATSRRRWTWRSWRHQQGHTARVLCWRRRDVVAWCAADDAGDRGVSLSPRPPAPCRVQLLPSSRQRPRNPPRCPTRWRPVRYAPLYYHCTRHSAILSVTDRDARFSPAPTSYCPPAVLAPSRTRRARRYTQRTKPRRSAPCTGHAASVSLAHTASERDVPTTRSSGTRVGQTRRLPTSNAEATRHGRRAAPRRFLSAWFALARTSGATGWTCVLVSRAAGNFPRSRRIFFAIRSRGPRLCPNFVNVRHNNPTTYLTIEHSNAYQVIIDIIW